MMEESIKGYSTILQATSKINKYRVHSPQPELSNPQGVLVLQKIAPAFFNLVPVKPAPERFTLKRFAYLRFTPETFA